MSRRSYGYGSNKGAQNSLLVHGKMNKNRGPLGVSFDRSHIHHPPFKEAGDFGCKQLLGDQNKPLPFCFKRREVKGAPTGVEGVLGGSPARILLLSCSPGFHAQKMSPKCAGLFLFVLLFFLFVFFFLLSLLWWSHRVTSPTRGQKVKRTRELKSHLSEDAHFSALSPLTDAPGPARLKTKVAIPCQAARDLWPIKKWHARPTASIAGFLPHYSLQHTFWDPVWDPEFTKQKAFLLCTENKLCLAKKRKKNLGFERLRAIGVLLHHSSSLLMPLKHHIALTNIKQQSCLGIFPKRTRLVRSHRLHLLTGDLAESQQVTRKKTTDTTDTLGLQVFFHSIKNTTPSTASTASSTAPCSSSSLRPKTLQPQFRRSPWPPHPPLGRSKPSPPRETSRFAAWDRWMEGFLERFVWKP